MNNIYQCSNCLRVFMTEGECLAHERLCCGHGAGAIGLLDNEALDGFRGIFRKCLNCGLIDKFECGDLNDIVNDINERNSAPDYDGPDENELFQELWTAICDFRAKIRAI